MILNAIIQSNSFEPETTDVSDPIKVLDISEITLASVYWFRPYLSADFPEITCDKTYFFLWSTDHDLSGSVNGGIYWGKGNNLDLSDFEELGLIIEGYQAETPKIARYSGETRPIYLYYHTLSTNPINAGTAQETNLITTTGGLLHTATWTQETNPLGLIGGEAHTGYLNRWEMDNGTVRGIHFTIGSNLPTTLPVFKYSDFASDGLSVTRGNQVDILTNIPSGYYWLPSFGEFFKLFDKWWWLGTVNSDTTGGADAVLAIYEANPDFTLKRLVSILNNDDVTSYGTKTWAIYPDLNAKIAHCYLNNKSAGVWYTAFDLNQLQFQ